ncbi:hypothetical protein [Nostoc sp.]|uniref:hypothetical protein n=1 Tax=Nostoc sp. TaxID=1180 RepID=UPI002FF68C6E
MPQALRCANTSRLRRETRLQRWFTKYAFSTRHYVNAQRLVREVRQGRRNNH